MIKKLSMCLIMVLLVPAIVEACGGGGLFERMALRRSIRQTQRLNRLLTAKALTDTRLALTLGTTALVLPQQVTVEREVLVPQPPVVVPQPPVRMKVPQTFTVPTVVIPRTLAVPTVPQALVVPPGCANCQQ